MTYDDILAAMQRLSDAVTCAEIEREEARRLVLVPGPASAVKLEAWLIAHGLDDVIAVKCSQFLPADTWFIVNERAMAAGQNEALQAMRPQFADLDGMACCGLPRGPLHMPGCMIGGHLHVLATTRTPGPLIRITLA